MQGIDRRRWRRIFHDRVEFGVRRRSMSYRPTEVLPLMTGGNHPCDSKTSGLGNGRRVDDVYAIRRANFLDGGATWNQN